MSDTGELVTDNLVTIDIQDGVADARLNRPEKYNALSPEMFQAIVAAGEQLAATKEVRAVVLSGNGRGFCAGLDMATMGGLGEGSSGGSDGSVLLSRDERPENFAQRPGMVWKRMPVPVIAASASVSSSNTEAPPCNNPKGCWVRASTIMDPSR